MSNFDKASLVMIPSGYKEDKIYSIKPTDGSGDLTFSRSNDTATRVNSDGLIEKVRTNLFPNGSSLLATGWDVQDATLTAGQTDPDGGTGALRVQLAGGAGTDFIAQIFSGSNVPYTRSVYIKAASAQTIRIVEPTSGANKIISLTTSYQRFDLSAAISGGFYGIRFDNEHDTAAKDFTIAFVQIETGDIATDYIATTTAAVSVGPVANLPRLDYLDSSCPKLLLEPQRTNVVLFSEQFDNAAWNKLGITVAANNTTSPSGYIDADKLIADAGTGNRVVYQGVVPVGVSTTTVYAKAGEFGGIVIASGTQGGFFNLTTGAYRTEYNSAPTAYNITSVGNGWYRCSVTMTSVSGDNLYIGPNDNVSTLLSLTSDGTSGIYAWGAQLEAGAYETSYIPTLSAASTRGADAASKTGISSLIGQTEGTLFWEVQIDTPVATANEAIFNIDAGAFGNTIYLTKSATGNIVGEMYVSSAAQASFTLSGISAGNYKIAFAYAQNNTAMFVNGVQVGSTDTSCNVPATSRIQLGNGALGPSTDKTKQALLFPTRLTDAEAIALTTL